MTDNLLTNLHLKTTKTLYKSVLTLKTNKLLDLLKTSTEFRTGYMHVKSLYTKTERLVWDETSHCLSLARGWMLTARPSSQDILIITLWCRVQWVLVQSKQAVSVSKSIRGSWAAVGTQHRNISSSVSAKIWKLKKKSELIKD